MYASSSYEKSSGFSENTSVSRTNTISNRIPVGITSLGDENQQIRIHLAVHKYNNSSSSPVYNKRNIISPNRHSFLRNSSKSRPHENEIEQTLKNEKKCGNRYEGVGTYPTVHLKKSSILYRPIKRFNEVKIPNPELPVNRFLNHLNELSPDFKQNTRSVLDVLQDLSRKRIHSKEEGDTIKCTSKGLGGDISVNSETFYKPLFVKKAKLNSVVTKDNTTQTSVSPSPDSSGTQFSESSFQNDTFDSRTELRKKLARKNNEIFASLSSSVTLNAMKRKLDKAVTTNHFENSNSTLLAKKIKKNEAQTSGNEETYSLKSVNGFKSNSNENIGKISRKSKTNDIKSPSPNKDRLTTIFLDMQNTSPKSQIFQKDSILNKVENLTEKNSLVLPTFSNNMFNKTNAFDTKATNHVTSDSTEHKTPCNGIKNSETSSALNSVTKKAEDKAEIISNDVSKNTMNLPANSNPTSNFINSNSASISQFSIGSSNNNTNFNIDSAKTVTKDLNNVKGNINENLLPIKTHSVGLNSENTSKNSRNETDNIGILNKSNNENTQTTSKPLNFGCSVENEIKNPDFSMFKFGDNKTLSSTQNQHLISTTSSASKAENLLSANSKNISNLAQNANSEYTFCLNSSDTTKTVTTLNSNSIHSKEAISFSNSQCALSTSVKPMYTFCQNELPVSKKQDFENNKNENDAFSKTNLGVSGSSIHIENPTTANSNLITQNPQLAEIFPFCNKFDNSSSSKGCSGTEDSKNLLNESVVRGQNSSQANVISNNVVTSHTNSDNQNNIIPTTSFTPTSIVQTSSLVTESDNKTSALFTFCQKPVCVEASTNLGTISTNTSNEQKSQQSVTFSFGSNSETQNFTDNKVSGVNIFGSKSQTSLFAFGQKSSMPQLSQSTAESNTTFSQSNITQPNQFGTVLSPKQTPISQNSLFAQNVSQPSNTAPITSQAPTFGQSSNLGTQTSSSFGTKPEPVSLGQPVLSNPFAQNNSDFSNKTSLFGSSTSAQTVCGFGTTVTSQPTAFGVPTSTQPSAGFGTSTPTQSPTGFGTPCTAPTSRFGLSSSSQISSFTQPFGQANKLGSSVSQTPGNIFGQTSVNHNSVVGSNFGTSSEQSNIFGTKTNDQTHIFGEAMPFGQTSTSQTFGTPNKFSFGVPSSGSGSTSTNSLPNTTSTVFSFSGSTSQTSPFNFGNNPSSMSNNTQTPFGFTSNESFKFGGTTAKEGSSFNSSNSSNFGFGQTNSNVTSEVKTPSTAFSFGNPQVSLSGSTFNFGSTPSPSLFSFGGSGSSTSSGSTFNFGMPQSGISFGQAPTSSSAMPFSVPGTFSIGSGSSQSRPRASSRLRRRP